MESIIISTCVIPVKNMLSSVIDYVYIGVQRTLYHMVQRQSPEVQYQQNRLACAGLLLYDYQ